METAKIRQMFIFMSMALMSVAEEKKHTHKPPPGYISDN